MFKREKVESKIDVELAQAQSGDEAANFIFIGIKYFLWRRPLRTALIILLFAGSVLYTVIDVYTGIVKAKARIEKQVKP
jgi:hypothetical protein